MKLGNGLISSRRWPGWCLVWSATICLVLAACGQRPGPTSTVPVTPAATNVAQTAESVTAQGVTAAPTTPPATDVPTATPVPLAVTVNGQDITLDAYDRELARCRAGDTEAGVDPQVCPAAVMAQLIKQAVVEQAAAAAGIGVAPAEVDAALNKITTNLGGPGALDAWLTADKYQASEFRDALQADLLRARMLDQVVAAVGPNAEQVHAREILVTSQATADAVLAQLQSGADFATLAIQYSRDLSSRAGGGDLGWFPRGVLTVPEVEQATFALQPGQTSAIIHSILGYHIVQVLDRDPQRPLSPAARQTLRATALSTWLDAQVAKATVVKHINS